MNKLEEQIYDLKKEEQVHSKKMKVGLIDMEDVHIQVDLETRVSGTWRITIRQIWVIETHWLISSWKCSWVMR